MLYNIIYIIYIRLRAEPHQDDPLDTLFTMIYVFLYTAEIVHNPPCRAGVLADAEPDQDVQHHTVYNIIIYYIILL